MSANQSFAKHNIPQSWTPARPQPAWDRTWATHEQMAASWKAKDDSARQWAREAVAFSEVITHGMTDAERRAMAKRARTEIAKDARKNGK